MGSSVEELTEDPACSAWGHPACSTTLVWVCGLYRAVVCILIGVGQLKCLSDITKENQYLGDCTGISLFLCPYLAHRHESAKEDFAT